MSVTSSRWVTASLDERHCGVTQPEPLVHWLEARVLVARRGSVEFRPVRLAALTPSWHFGESDSPTSLCKRQRIEGGREGE